MKSIKIFFRNLFNKSKPLVSVYVKCNDQKEIKVGNIFNSFREAEDAAQEHVCRLVFQTGEMVSASIRYEKVKEII